MASVLQLSVLQKRLASSRPPKLQSRSRSRLWPGASWSKTQAVAHLPSGGALSGA